MSFGSSPSPRPLSGSLLVIDTKVTAGFAPQPSLVSSVAVIWTSLWFGDQRVSGDSMTRKVGVPVSRTVTSVVAVAWRPPGSVTVNVNVWVPNDSVNGTTAVVPTTLFASSFQTKLSTSPSGSLDLDPSNCAKVP